MVHTFAYKTIGDVKIEADVERPERSGPYPVLVWLHGGALINGARQETLSDLRELARAEGHVFVSADYRMAPEVKLPQIIEDLRDFMRWVGEEGPALFDADATRIVVAGGSAGGYLAFMTGLGRPRPKAVVSYWGYGDIDGAWYTQPSEFYRTTCALVSREDAWRGVGAGVVTNAPWGGPRQKARQPFYLYMRQNGLWTKDVTGLDPVAEPRTLDPYCPVRNITRDYPPVLMIHGTNDHDVPYQKSLDMADQLKRHGVRHELLSIPGGEHGLDGGDKSLIASAYARAREFIKEHLG